MHITISNTSGVPLYEQIYEQIRRMILDGSLKEDDPLPTIRSLAKDLRMSIITTTRAYKELERDGYIYSVVGRGSFVAKRNEELHREERLSEMDQKLAEAADLARYCGLRREEFLQAAQYAFGDVQE